MPPMSTAKGHCSQDWHGKQIWTGFCRIILVNSVVCRVQLINEDKTLFAESVIKGDEGQGDYDAHVQRAYDSTRAYSISLMSESGQRANVGVIFPERNDSFDFIQGLDEFKKAYRVEKGLDKNFQKPNETKIAAQLSLKEGEMITLNIVGVPQSNIKT